MQAMLADKFQLTPKYCQQSSVISPLPVKASDINLFKISLVIYRLLSKRKNHETFAASFDKLDSLLANNQVTDQVVLVIISEIDYSPDERLIDKCLAKFL
jgi:hypothetical protein